MKNLIKSLLVSVFLFAGSGYALAQGGADPEAAMLSYADATRSFDAERISRLMHPEALQRFRDTFDGAFLGENSDRARADLLPMFSVSTYDEFQALSNTEVFQQLSETIFRVVPELSVMMADSEYEPIGIVTRDDEVYLTYVLTVSLEGRSVSQEIVQRLKQHEGEWFLMLPPKSEATIAAIEAQY